MYKDKQTILNDKHGVVPVGLSYCSQSRRFYIQVKKYINGETKVKHQWKQGKTLEELLTERINTPKRTGLLFQNGLTTKAKAKIKFASRIFQFQVLDGQTEKAYASFITLTYGLHYPEDHLSKKHLEAFIKRIKRKHPYFQFIWVAEKQKRGAIHYHILTPQYIPKSIINKAWNGIVKKWQRSQIENGCKQQEVYPHVGAVNDAGKYMTKYMQKEGENIGGNMYGIDMHTRSLMEPEIITLESDIDMNDLSQHLSSHIQSKDAVTFTNLDFDKNHQAWISKINTFALTEFLDYSIHELNIKKHDNKDS